MVTHDGHTAHTPSLRSWRPRCLAPLRAALHLPLCLPPEPCRRCWAAARGGSACSCTAHSAAIWSMWRQCACQTDSSCARPLQSRRLLTTTGHAGHASASRARAQICPQSVRRCNTRRSAASRDLRTEPLRLGIETFCHALPPAVRSTKLRADSREDARCKRSSRVSAHG